MLNNVFKVSLCNTLQLNTPIVDELIDTDVYRQMK